MSNRAEAEALDAKDQRIAELEKHITALQEKDANCACEWGAVGPCDYHKAKEAQAREEGRREKVQAILCRHPLGPQDISNPMYCNYESGHVGTHGVTFSREAEAFREGIEAAYEVLLRCHVTPTETRLAVRALLSEPVREGARLRLLHVTQDLKRCQACGAKWPCADAIESLKPTPAKKEEEGAEAPQTLNLSSEDQEDLIDVEATRRLYERQGTAGFERHTPPSPQPSDVCGRRGCHLTRRRHEQIAARIPIDPSASFGWDVHAFEEPQSGAGEGKR